MFEWGKSKQEKFACPVCKNEITLKSVIPIYTQEDTKKKKPHPSEQIPPRP